MSIVPRCSDCDDLITLCRCDGNPNPIYRPSFVERYERERDLPREPLSELKRAGGGAWFA